MAAAVFRFRVAIFVLLYALGFLAPWAHFFGGGHGTLWLAASALLARTGWLSLSAATRTVTLIALGSLVLGTALRVWGTAYLGSDTMRGTAMQSARLVSTGPYGYVRNPLYIGAWLLAMPTSLLMPPDGAAVFVIGFSVFVQFLISTEERFLAARLGTPYREYCRDVPRLLPRFSGFVPGTTERPLWFRALLDETYPVAFTVCFAFFAWSYNTRILIRCLLVCYGLSLVVRALTGTAKNPVAA